MAEFKRALNKPNKQTPTKTVKQPAKLGGKSVTLTGKAAVSDASDFRKGKLTPNVGTEMIGTTKTTKTAKGTKLRSNKIVRKAPMNTNASELSKAQMSKKKATGSK